MGNLVLNGATSGATTLQPTDATTNTITLPANSGTVITTASSGKVIPTAALPAGTVLQVVDATTTTYTGINSTSYQAITNLTATITPTSSTSKILVIVSIGEFRSAQNVGARFKLYRNGSSLVFLGDEVGYNGSGSVTPTLGLSFAYSYLDSPTTTSATTYAMYAAKLTTNSGDLQIIPNGGAHASIQLMEIAA